MRVRQLSIFVVNEPGQIRKATAALADAGVSIRGLSASDTADFGIVRIVVDKPDEGAAALHDRGFLVRTSDVICIRLADTAGELDRMFEAVAAIDVDVIYTYSLTNSYLVMMTSDQEAAAKVLHEIGAELVDDNGLV